ncbi:MAG: 23S rRNA (adenine(2030)-N(6))-methyltransferase RlmJ [Gammaproteobacteria bacterium]|nr:23S rRNA (adenine(2030)-N(6))-methyltransferase RlmJ [Gammaproteobacteria bacterium]
MKYRHAYHAGNFADVTKHVVLVALLARLALKPRPLFFLETHAGRGRYDLTAPAGGEARTGILRLAAAPRATLPALLVRYLDLACGPAELPRSYPGSPLLAAALLRPGDRAAFAELRQDEAAALARELRHDRRCSVHCRDGWEALGALLRPAEKRGLVLIDPPYEEPAAELERVATALAQTARRWPQGVLLAWYPIKLGVVTARFHRQLRAAQPGPLLVAELCVHADDSRAGLNGSGAVIVNPPWQLDADLHAAWPALHAILAPNGTGRSQVAWLVGP